MIHEMAVIDIAPGAEDAFVAAYREARGAILGSPGAGGIRLTRGIETPTRFVLHVEWDSVDDHMAFRDTEAFTTWRGMVGPHFAGPPDVEHYVDVE